MPILPGGLNLDGDGGGGGGSSPNTILWTTNIHAHAAGSNDSTLRIDKIAADDESAARYVPIPTDQVTVDGKTAVVTSVDNSNSDYTLLHLDQGLAGPLPLGATVRVDRLIYAPVGDGTTVTNLDGNTAPEQQANTRIHRVVLPATNYFDVSFQATASAVYTGASGNDWTLRLEATSGAFSHGVAGSVLVIYVPASRSLAQLKDYIDTNLSDIFATSAIIGAGSVGTVALGDHAMGGGQDAGHQRILQLTTAHPVVGPMVGYYAFFGGESVAGTTRRKISGVDTTSGGHQRLYFEEDLDFVFASGSTVLVAKEVGYSGVVGHPSAGAGDENPAAATQAEAEAGSETTLRSWSPQRVGQAVAALAPSGGGGGEDNPDAATQAEAEAGTVSALRSWSPERIAQAIAALESGEENPDAATQTEAEAGTVAALRSWSPERVAQAIAALESGEENPDAATQTEAEAGTVAALRSWSPERVAQAIAALAPSGGGGGEDNPDAVTQAEAEAGTETALRSWSPERVAQAVTRLAVRYQLEANATRSDYVAISNGERDSIGDILGLVNSRDIGPWITNAVTADISLAGSHASQVHLVTVSGVTVTLSGSDGAGFITVVANVSTSDITLAAPTGGTIDGGASITIGANEAVLVVGILSNTYVAISSEADESGSDDGGSGGSAVTTAGITPKRDLLQYGANNTFTDGRYFSVGNGENNRYIGLGTRGGKIKSVFFNISFSVDVNPTAGEFAVRLWKNDAQDVDNFLGECHLDGADLPTRAYQNGYMQLVTGTLTAHNSTTVTDQVDVDEIELDSGDVLIIEFERYPTNVGNTNCRGMTVSVEVERDLTESELLAAKNPVAFWWWGAARTDRVPTGPEATAFIGPSEQANRMAIPFLNNAGVPNETFGNTDFQWGNIFVPETGATDSDLDLDDIDSDDIDWPAAGSRERVGFTLQPGNYRGHCWLRYSDVNVASVQSYLALRKVTSGGLDVLVAVADTDYGEVSNPRSALGVLTIDEFTASEGDVFYVETGGTNNFGINNLGYMRLEKV